MKCCNCVSIIVATIITICPINVTKLHSFAVPNTEELAGKAIKTDQDATLQDVVVDDCNDLLKNAEASQLIKQTLDGFLIVLSNEGDITYVSDNITEYLGIAKVFNNMPV